MVESSLEQITIQYVDDSNNIITSDSSVGATLINISTYWNIFMILISFALTPIKVS